MHCDIEIDNEVRPSTVKTSLHGLVGCAMDVIRAKV
jgi:hypothetical protein